MERRPGLNGGGRGRPVLTDADVWTVPARTRVENASVRTGLAAPDPAWLLPAGRRARRDSSSPTSPPPPSSDSSSPSRMRADTASPPTPDAPPPSPEHDSTPGSTTSTPLFAARQLSNHLQDQSSAQSRNSVPGHMRTYTYTQRAPQGETDLFNGQPWRVTFRAQDPPVQQTHRPRGSPHDIQQPIRRQSSGKGRHNGPTRDSESYQTATPEMIARRIQEARRRGHGW